MKNVLTGLVLGAMLSVAPAVQAATELAFQGFTITYVDGPAPENWNIGVAAQTPLTTSISLDTLNGDVQYFPADDLTGVGATNGAGHQATLRIEVNAGYRVTGIGLHALGYGELGIGQAPDAEPGSASNFASVGFLLTAPGTTVSRSWQQADFNGFQPVALSAGPLSLDGTFHIDLGATVFAQAWGSVGPESSSSSHALASIGNALLNVEVAVVPEPGAWAMTIAGVGLIILRITKKDNFMEKFQ